MNDLPYINAYNTAIMTSLVFHTLIQVLNSRNVTNVLPYTCTSHCYTDATCLPYIYTSYTVIIIPMVFHTIIWSQD